MEKTIQFSGTPAQAVEAIRRAFSDPNDNPIRDQILIRIGNALLSEIEQDFVVKSRGGTGQDGIKWKPLSPKTIAQRRITAAERKKAGLTSANMFRGLLTAEENKLWKAIYSRRLARLQLVMPYAQARAKAATAAWAILKSRGAKTKLGLFGGRIVDILRDTGELLRSFSPAIMAGEPAPYKADADGQVFRIESQATVAVGSNKKPWHHRGIPGRLPARPFWPLDGSLPEAWAQSVSRAAERGIAEGIRMSLEGKL